MLRRAAGPDDDDGVRTVTSVARAGNTRTDSAHNRYNIDPKDLIRIQREGRSEARTLLVSIIRIPIIRHSGHRPIWRKHTGLAVLT